MAVHKVLLGADVAIVEGLTNLEGLLAGKFCYAARRPPLPAWTVSAACVRH
jgi:kynurenine formamidase